jgi:hypothetical protein
MRNRLSTVGVIVSSLATALACGASMTQGEDARVAFVTKPPPIEFSFPKGWFANPKDNPFDLQCFSPAEDMNTGVFAYSAANIASDRTALDIFQRHIDDIKSKRRNFTELEGLQKQDKGDKILTSITYVGDKELSRHHYCFTLVEFKNHKDIFAVVLQIATPSAWKEGKPVFREILRSARTMPRKP